MRFGIALGTLLRHEDIIKSASMADNADLILIPESWGRDAFVTLGMLSSLTKYATLGSAIVNIYSRTPANIAMAAATLDVYSNKRALIGLGASSKAIVENWHGLEFKDTLVRMREYVESIRYILTGNKVNYSGKIVRINNFRLGFKPLRDRIPIYIAAIRDKMLKLALEIGDGLILYLYPDHEVRRIRCREGYEILYLIITAISDDMEKAIERVKKTLAFYIAVGDIYADFLSTHGYKEEVESIREEYLRHGLINIHEYVSERMLNSLAIYGDKEECKKRFNRFASMNVTPILHINPVYDVEKSLIDLLSIIKA
ncbi:MAG: LLM class flavin-dependent oxidoreductase [Candidatus Nitrosocaldaceae archaeon]